MKSDFCTGLSGPILTAAHERKSVLIRGIREIRGSGANCRTCREEAQNTQKVVEWGLFLRLLRLFAATSAFCDHLSSIGIRVKLLWGGRRIERAGTDAGSTQIRQLSQPQRSQRSQRKTVMNGLHKFSIHSAGESDLWLRNHRKFLSMRSMRSLRLVANAVFWINGRAGW
jgi:hypothetical protein